MIRIYEGFLKPETCALPTRIVNPNEDDLPLMVNSKAKAIFSQLTITVQQSTWPSCAVSAVVEIFAECPFVLSCDCAPEKT